MILHTTGTVLGVRSEERTNKKTGEVREYRTLDIYDPADGPGELSLAEGVEVPAAGTVVDCKVQVRAYSGFVRDGVAGDARIMFQCLDVQPIEAEGATPIKSRSRRTA